MKKLVSGVLSFIFSTAFSAVCLASAPAAADSNIYKFKDPRAVAKDLISATTPAGDSELASAIQNRRDVFFTQGSNLTVVKILPDDTQGLKHQRWYVRLSGGATLFAVYNLDITDRVPVEIGQSMTIGGQFIFTNQGPLIHWLHEDPTHRRPDGFVEVNGKKYGKITHPDR